MAISGPAGFLGSRVVDNILEVHAHRERAGQEPGELLLLSSSPGHLMKRLTRKYGAERMKTVRRGLDSDAEAPHRRPSRFAACHGPLRWLDTHTHTAPRRCTRGAVLCRGFRDTPRPCWVCVLPLCPLPHVQSRAAHTHAAGT